MDTVHLNAENVSGKRTQNPTHLLNLADPAESKPRTAWETVDGEVSNLHSIAQTMSALASADFDAPGVAGAVQDALYWLSHKIAASADTIGHCEASPDC